MGAQGLHVAFNNEGNAQGNISGIVCQGYVTSKLRSSIVSILSASPRSDWFLSQKQSGLVLVEAAHTGCPGKCEQAEEHSAQTNGWKRRRRLVCKRLL